jgi:ATP-binding cassette subfamily F protein uup
MAKLEPPDGGTIAFKKETQVGFLPQEPHLNQESTVSDEIRSVLGELEEKVSRYHAISTAMKDASPSKMDELLKEQQALGGWIDHHGGWETRHRIDQVLSQLGVPDSNASVGGLSGGMKKRVALAKLVLQSPDLLLLDEPTNHLDAATIEWLESFLIAYPGAVILITHDRYFLDRVVQRMFELEKGKIYSYLGSYSSYLLGRAERLEQEEQFQGRLANLLRRESEWMARGPKARGTKQKARIKRFGEMQGRQKKVGDQEVGLRFESRHRLGNTILGCTYLSKTLGGSKLIDQLSFDLKAGDRVGIIGPNGSGKTTLLKMIIGELHPSSGSIIRGKNTRIAYFDQHRDSLDPDLRVEDALGDGQWVTIGEERRHKTGYLSDFLFEPSDQKRLIRTLSGGEKARLMLARMMLEDVNLLILDEPTNDLDIPTLQLLDDCLVNYTGCVLMVTHDRFFLDKVATGILSFEGDGRVQYTLGNYEAYRKRIKEKEETRRTARKEQKALSAPETGTTSSRKKKGLSFKERRELEVIQKEIENLEAEQKKLETLLADPGSYSREEIQQYGEELVRIEKVLAERIDRWEILEAKGMEG